MWFKKTNMVEKILFALFIVEAYLSTHRSEKTKNWQ